MTRVTDHALLRYLERAKGIDVESVRAGLEAQLVRTGNAAGKLGVDTYMVHYDGVTFIVRKGFVTTTLPRLADSSRYHALGPREA